MHMSAVNFRYIDRLCCITSILVGNKQEFAELRSAFILRREITFVIIIIISLFIAVYRLYIYASFNRLVSTDTITMFITGS